MFDEFIIFPWGNFERWDGPRQNPDEFLQGLKDCGFNASPFVRPERFEACRRAGLKIYAMFDDCNEWKLSDSIAGNYDVPDAEAVERLADHLKDLPEDVIAVYLKDEPGTKLFDRLRLLSDAVKKYAPGREPYFNLFPNYAVCGDPDLSQLQAPDYDTYLDRFCAEVNPCSISLDNYMLMICGDGADRKRFYSYFRNLVQAQNACKKYGIPFQHVVCSNQLRAHHHAPTFTSLAMQAYTSMAAGSKSLSWFLYFGYGGYFYSPVDDFGEDTRTRTWYYLREVNRQILPIGRLLFPMKFEEMYFRNSRFIEGSHNIREIPELKNVKISGNCMVGKFDDNGRKVFVLVNMDYGQSLHCEFGDISRWNIFDGIQQKFRKMLIAPHGTQESSLWIAPGCGEVITVD